MWWSHSGSLMKIRLEGEETAVDISISRPLTLRRCGCVAFRRRRATSPAYLECRGHQLRASRRARRSGVEPALALAIHHRSSLCFRPRREPPQSRQLGLTRHGCVTRGLVAGRERKGSGTDSIAIAGTRIRTTSRYRRLPARLRGAGVVLDCSPNTQPLAAIAPDLSDAHRLPALGRLCELVDRDGQGPKGRRRTLDGPGLRCCHS